MEELLIAIEAFEKRNNISTKLTLYSDGSSMIQEFWDEEELFEGKSPKELFEFLIKTRYKLDDRGWCVSPVVKINK